LLIMTPAVFAFTPRRRRRRRRRRGALAGGNDPLADGYRCRRNGSVELILRRVDRVDRGLQPPPPRRP
jgi:hypothetical protein